MTEGDGHQLQLVSSFLKSGQYTQYVHCCEIRWKKTCFRKILCNESQLEAVNLQAVVTSLLGRAPLKNNCSWAPEDFFFNPVNSGISDVPHQDLYVGKMHAKYWSNIYQRETSS